MIFILITTIDYIFSTKRFDVTLTNFWFVLKHLCIDNMSFKFYSVIVNSFTKFLLLYYWFRHIDFTLPFQLSFPVIIFMWVYWLFLSFLFINKCLPVNKLAQITSKLTHPVVLQLSTCLFCNGFLTGIPGTFRYISTWWL